jgi:hypothetical protein
MSSFYSLDFEKPLAELAQRLSAAEARLKSDFPALATEPAPDELSNVQAVAIDPAAQKLQAEIAELRAQHHRQLTDIYGKLTPWQTVRVARHPRRPQTRDYINMICRDFAELHGDRRFGEDPAIVTGFARIGPFKVMVVGHQKGKEHQREDRLPLRLRPPRGLPQGAGQDGAGRQVRRADRHARRHPRRLPRPRRRAARPGRGDRRQHARDVPPARPDRQRRHRRGRLGRRPGDRRRRPRRHAPATRGTRSSAPRAAPPSSGRKPTSRPTPPPPSPSNSPPPTTSRWASSIRSSPSPSAAPTAIPKAPQIRCANGSFGASKSSSPSRPMNCSTPGTHAFAKWANGSKRKKLWRLVNRRAARTRTADRAPAANRSP